MLELQASAGIYTHRDGAHRVPMGRDNGSSRKAAARDQRGVRRRDSVRTGESEGMGLAGYRVLLMTSGQAASARPPAARRAPG
jgi:hypothetical protein